MTFTKIKLIKPSGEIIIFDTDFTDIYSVYHLKKIIESKINIPSCSLRLILDNKILYNNTDKIFKILYNYPDDCEILEITVIRCSVLTDPNWKLNYSDKEIIEIANQSKGAAAEIINTYNRPDLFQYLINYYNDKDIASIAIIDDRSNLSYITDDLFDVDEIINLIKENIYSNNYNRYSYKSIFDDLPKYLLNNKYFAYEILDTLKENDNYREIYLPFEVTLKYYSLEIQDDYNIVKKYINANPHAIEYASPKLKKK